MLDSGSLNSVSIHSNTNILKCSNCHVIKNKEDFSLILIIKKLSKGSAFLKNILFSPVDALPGSGGPELQAALKEMTGQGTVPNIFINGKHLGGCDSLLATIAGGKLDGLLKAQ